MIGRLVLFSLVVSAAAEATTWPAASRALVAARNARPRLLRNPHLLTIVDQLQLQTGGWSHVTDGSVVLRILKTSPEFVTPAGAAHGLDVRAWPRPGRPLAVYLPGIFQGSTAEDTGRVVVTLSEAGYQVVVVPNPLGAEYFTSFPVAPPHALNREAAVVSAAIAELRRLMGVDRVRLIAASYGAALGARAWAADQASPAPTIADLTLLFPQYDLGAARELIDGAIATSPFVDGPRATIGRVYQSSLRKLVTRRRRRFRADAAENFAARRYPAVAAQALGDRRAADGLTLEKVMRDFVADDEVTQTYASDETRLTFWLDRGHRARGSADVRILTARDDWTNAPGAWDRLSGWLDDADHLLVLENAGHAGVVAEEWFRQTILEAMR